MRPRRYCLSGQYMNSIKGERSPFPQTQWKIFPQTPWNAPSEAREGFCDCVSQSQHDARMLGMGRENPPITYTPLLQIIVSHTQFSFSNFWDLASGFTLNFHTYHLPLSSLQVMLKYLSWLKYLLLVHVSLTFYRLQCCLIASWTSNPTCSSKFSLNMGSSRGFSLNLIFDALMLSQHSVHASIIALIKM